MRVERAVFDTNILISAALQPLGPPRRALSLVRESGLLVTSPPLIEELLTRLMRPKFDRYLSRERRAQFMVDILAVADRVAIEGRAMGCRDPDDDKVIETALAGGAEVIVTGDEDLLSMPARPEFRVLTPRALLDLAAT